MSFFVKNWAYFLNPSEKGRGNYKGKQMNVLKATIDHDISRTCSSLKHQLNKDLFAMHRCDY